MTTHVGIIHDPLWSAAQAISGALGDVEAGVAVPTERLASITADLVSARARVIIQELRFAALSDAIINRNHEQES